MTLLRAIDSAIRHLCEGLALLYLVAVALTVYEVFSRYVLNAPTIWVHDLAIFLTGVGFVFGGPYALQKNAHVRLDVMGLWLPERWQTTIEYLSHALISLFLLILVYVTYGQAEKAVAIMETSGRAWDVPIPAYLKAVLAFGALVFLVQSLVTLAKVKTAASGRREPNGEDAEPWA